MFTKSQGFIIPIVSVHVVVCVTLIMMFTKFISILLCNNLPCQYEQLDGQIIKLFIPNTLFTSSIICPSYSRQFITLSGVTRYVLTLLMYRYKKLHQLTLHVTIILLLFLYFCNSFTGL